MPLPPWEHSQILSFGHRSSKPLTKSINTFLSHSLHSLFLSWMKYEPHRFRNSSLIYPTYAFFGFICTRLQYFLTILFMFISPIVNRLVACTSPNRQVLRMNKRMQEMHSLTFWQIILFCFYPFRRLHIRRDVFVESQVACCRFLLSVPVPVLVLFLIKYSMFVKANPAAQTFE